MLEWVWCAILLQCCAGPSLQGKEELVQRLLKEFPVVFQKVPATCTPAYGQEAPSGHVAQDSMADSVVSATDFQVCLAPHPFREVPSRSASESALLGAFYCPHDAVHQHAIAKQRFQKLFLSCGLSTCILSCQMQHKIAQAAVPLARFLQALL